MKKLERKLRNTRQTVEAFACNCANTCANSCVSGCHGPYPDYSYPYSGNYQGGAYNTTA